MGLQTGNTLSDSLKTGPQLGKGGLSSTPPAAIVTNSALVSGAGSAAANGTYTYRGILNGKPYYNLLGQPTDNTKSSISWTGSAWDMLDSTGVLHYYDSSSAVLYPWLATWLADADGSAPAPTITII